jgi:hypothetical protein
MHKCSLLLPAAALITRRSARNISIHLRTRTSIILAFSILRFAFHGVLPCALGHLHQLVKRAQGTVRAGKKSSLPGGGWRINGPRAQYNVRFLLPLLGIVFIINAACWRQYM